MRRDQRPRFFPVLVGEINRFIGREKEERKKEGKERRGPFPDRARPYSNMAASSVAPFRTGIGRRPRPRPLPSPRMPFARPAGKMAARPLVQYVVLRGDLGREPLSWPLGALVAQACHAALAVVHAHREHPDTAAYLAQGGSMRTVVLEALDECALTALTETLQQNNIDHNVWVEQPENIATCIALRPYPKEHVHQHLKKFKLLK